MDADTAQKARDTLLVSDDSDRKVVHTLVNGPFGADWYLSDVEDFIDKAVSVDLMGPGTIAYAMGHKLKVVSGGRTVFFETREGADE